MDRNIGMGLFMRRRAFLLIFVCCTCVVAKAEAGSLDSTGQASASVTRYLESRDTLLQRFKEKSISLRMSDKESEKDRAAQRRGLNRLETQLRAIIGSVHIEGFKDDGKINLESLRETPFADPDRMMDGLVYTGKDGRLFVTTRELAIGWLNHGEVGHARGMLHLQQHESLFFPFEAAVMPFMPLPIKASNHVYIRTSLALVAQDSGPFPPGVVYIYMEKGGHVLLLEHYLAVDIPQIPACEREYDSIMEKEGPASHPWNPDPAFLAYTRCFANKAGTLSFYKPMLKNIQAMANHIMSSRM